MNINRNKPNYIPEQFLIATHQGWVDSRNNEVLVAIRGLDKLVRDESKQYDINEKPLDVILETVIEIGKPELEENIEEKIENIINEDKVESIKPIIEEEEEEEEEETVKPRGRPRSNKNKTVIIK